MAQSDHNPDYNKAKVIFLAFVAALGGFLFGYDSGVINGTVEALQRAFNSDEVGTGFNVASMLLGCAAGAFFAGNLADKFGRKKVLIGTAFAFLISAWGSGIAASSPEFVIYRILGGLAVGAASVLAPAYISEIAPQQIRGRLTTLQQLMIVIGLLASFISNYFIATYADSASAMYWLGFQAWQWMFWMEMIPAFLFFVFLFFIPESPRYLVAAGDKDEARSVLLDLNPGRSADDKISEIEETLEEERRPRLSDIINRKTGGLHAIVWVGIALAILQQFTGINIVFYYGAVLWKAAGFAEGSALLTNILSGTVNLLFTFVAIWLIDKLGRRPLLLIGSLGTAISLGLLAIVFSTAGLTPDGSLDLSQTQAIMALTLANTFVAFFAFTWGPVMWVMLGEIFPNKFRGAALAVCGLIHWLSNFTITMTFPLMLEGIGLGASYFIYSAFGFIGYFIVKAFVSETKGKSLEELSLSNA